MGTTIFVRNRYWWHKTLYDDYSGRFTRVGYGAAALVWLPHYWFGIYLNRAYEEYNAHNIYSQQFSHRRQRLAQNLIYEEFDMHLEEWIKLKEQRTQQKSVIELES